MLRPANVDWEVVKTQLREILPRIRPVTYDELCGALETTHEVGGLATGGLVEDAVSEGYLDTKEAGYVFRTPSTSTADISPSRHPITPQRLGSIETVETDEVVYPEQMRARDNWVCWAGNKQPRAPWEGHLYPVQWAAELPENELPTVPFTKARKWQSMADSMSLDCPEGVSSEALELGYLLPHDNGMLALIDLDDVRNPETGDIHPAAREILRNAGSYAEISQSGAGVHIFVTGELPAGIGQVVEPIDDDPFVGSEPPKVEVYDHGRVVAMTGNHVRDTPIAIANTQSVLHDIVDTYTDQGDATQTVEDLIEAEVTADSTDGRTRSPYYEFDPGCLAMGSEWVTRGDQLRGPHPGHGSTTGTNCAIAADGQWYCFRHDVGGGGLQLLAVVEEFLECPAAGSGGLDHLSDRDFLKLCLLARDRYGQQGKPPYRALQATAWEVGILAESDETLGNMYEIARSVYDSLSFEEL